MGRPIEKISYSPPSTGVLRSLVAKVYAQDPGGKLSPISLVCQYLGYSVNLDDPEGRIIASKFFERIAKVTGITRPFGICNPNSSDLRRRVESLAANFAGWIAPRKIIDQKIGELRTYHYWESEKFWIIVKSAISQAPPYCNLMRFLSINGISVDSLDRLAELINNRGKKEEDFFNLLAEHLYASQIKYEKTEN